MKKKLITSLFLIVTFYAFGQNESFPESPLEARFETSDIPNFWIAFDSLALSNKNPFERYINKGTKGLEGFIPHRIISADSLLNMVTKRKGDYEKMRGIETLIKKKEKETIPYFYALEYWYPYATYPPVYFVFGRFNSGGTSSEEGLIIGAEKLTDLEGLPNLVIHESIHFQQKWPNRNPTLLEQSILEGSADFIAELVTGKLGNQKAHEYGNLHQEKLAKEFIEIMNGDVYEDWLYGTSGKDDRPNDLGYWMGYKIVEAYFNKMDDKKLAVNHILNIEDFKRFLETSGFLSQYLK